MYIKLHLQTRLPQSWARNRVILRLRVDSGSEGDAVCDTHKRKLTDLSRWVGHTDVQKRAKEDIEGPAPRRILHLRPSLYRRKEGSACCLRRSALLPASRRVPGAGALSSANAAGSHLQATHSPPLHWGPSPAATAETLLLTRARSQHLGLHDGGGFRRAPQGGGCPTPAPHFRPRLCPLTCVRSHRLRCLLCADSAGSGPRWVSRESTPRGLCTAQVGAPAGARTACAR